MFKRLLGLMLIFTFIGIKAGRHGNHGYATKGRNAGINIDWKHINRQATIANNAKSRKHYKSWKADKAKANELCQACACVGLIVGWATINAWLCLDQYKIRV